MVVQFVFASVYNKLLQIRFDLENHYSHRPGKQGILVKFLFCADTSLLSQLVVLCGVFEQSLNQFTTAVLFPWVRCQNTDNLLNGAVITQEATGLCYGSCCNTFPPLYFSCTVFMPCDGSFCLVGNASWYFITGHAHSNSVLC